MQNSILVSKIAQRVGATSDDIDSLDAVWQGMMRRDDVGQLWVSGDRQGYILGALDAAVDDRKDQRIQEADAQLVASYQGLARSPRRATHGVRGAAQQQKEMLASVNKVLDALVELVDAKLDARRMKPCTAAQIKDEAGRLRAEAQQNAASALRAIQFLLDLAA